MLTYFWKLLFAYAMAVTFAYIFALGTLAVLIVVRYSDLVTSAAVPQQAAQMAINFWLSIAMLAVHLFLILVLRPAVFPAEIGAHA